MLDKTRQDKRVHDRMKQDKTRQDKTRGDWIEIKMQKDDIFVMKERHRIQGPQSTE